MLLLRSLQVCRQRWHGHGPASTVLRGIIRRFRFHSAFQWDNCRSAASSASGLGPVVALADAGIFFPLRAAGNKLVFACPRRYVIRRVA